MPGENEGISEKIPGAAQYGGVSGTLMISPGGREEE